MELLPTLLMHVLGGDTVTTVGHGQHAKPDLPSVLLFEQRWEEERAPPRLAPFKQPESGRRPFHLEES